VDPIEIAFSNIYRRNRWGDPESRSGEGSSLRVTEGMRSELPKLFAHFGIQSIFDAPCGDLNWMKEVLRACDIRYVGADIVGELVDKLQSTYGTARVRFARLDITRAAFPPAQLWLCRDSLFHLPFREIFAAFDRYIESGIPWVLTTSSVVPPDHVNKDIRIGDFRPLDLFREPFNFPQGVHWRIEDPVGANMRELCLWSREQLLMVLPNHKPVRQAVADRGASGP